jgi:hypothetical protein
MSKRAGPENPAPKKRAKKKINSDPNCVICFEQGNVPCRDGVGCTAKMCWACVGKLYAMNNDPNCPVCRRLFFSPNFTKLYEGAEVDPGIFAAWHFSYNGVQAEARMLHDEKIQGQAIVLLQCPFNVSHKAKDIENLEKYAADVGVIASEIDDSDTISMVYTEYDGTTEVLGETEPFKHVTSQLTGMGLDFNGVPGIYDYIRLSGKNFKSFLKQGRFY